MSDRVDHDADERAAAAWAMRHPLSSGEADELERWLSSNPLRPGLLLRAMAGLSAIDRALAPEEASASASAPAPSSIVAASHPGRRRVLVGSAGAIAAAMAGMIGWSRLAHERVVTRQGEIRRLPLSDGSIATINTDSALRVLLSQEDRQIVLDRGEAWFQVAKDKRRPFVVDAGMAKARAVGTAFSVERRDDGVRVSVTEGIVEVWATEARGALTILRAGQSASFDNGTASLSTVTAPHAIERSLAWRNGEISLEDETLGAAVAQFNRYNRRRLVLADPGLSDMRLVGLFHIDKPEEFAATLQATHDVSVATTGDRIVISQKMR